MTFSFWRIPMGIVTATKKAGGITSFYRPSDFCPYSGIENIQRLGGRFKDTMTGLVLKCWALQRFCLIHSIWHVAILQRHSTKSIRSLLIDNHVLFKDSQGFPLCKSKHGWFIGMFLSFFNGTKIQPATLPKTNIAPQNRPGKACLSTIHFHGAKCYFQVFFGLCYNQSLHLSLESPGLQDTIVPSDFFVSTISPLSFVSQRKKKTSASLKVAIVFQQYWILQGNRCGSTWCTDILRISLSDWRGLTSIF